MKKNKKVSHKKAPTKKAKAPAKTAAKKPKKPVKIIAIKKPKLVPKAAKKPDVKKLVKSAQKIVVKKPVVIPKANEPKPKGLYSIEYQVNSSPDVLFEFISTPGGLEKWFADRVYIIESNFVFNWEDGEQRLAKQIAIKEKDWVRFHWLDEAEKRYFEFKIVIDDLTSEVALIVSDFADTPIEQEESTRLWNQQISDLHHSIGSS